MNLDLGQLGRNNFQQFCLSIQDVFIGQKWPCDLIVAAGNSGLSMTKYTKMILAQLGLRPPAEIRLPLYRYHPGKRDQKRFKFDNSVLLPSVLKQLEHLSSPIKNILFVDDEIGQGTTTIGVYQLLTSALAQKQAKILAKFLIVAEDQGFKIPKIYPNISFRAYAKKTPGLNNVIFLQTPAELEKPISDYFGNDKKFPFHWRINLLLDLPLKEFRGGRPKFTNKYLLQAKKDIPNFNLLQKKYLKYIQTAIKLTLNQK